MRNGKILFAGEFNTLNSVDANRVARLVGTAVAQNSAPFDFDGDGRTDIGIFRPVGAASEWWINRSGNGQTFALQFG
ncbi:MAG: delta-60 repeat domain-containing protein, partial [Pyrinomonadaceae bacterium]